MFKYKKIVKNLSGFVLGVGYLNNSILTEINKNNNIEVDILSNNSLLTDMNMIDSNVSKKGKRVNIKKLRKSFRNKKPDYILCNVDSINKYLKYFIKDSLYITRNKIYIYSDSNETELEDIFKKYKRYHDDVILEKDLIIINTINYKRNIFKNIWYYIVDSFVNLYEAIGNILAG